MPKIIDPFGRQIDYLRVSVTDHCNYRCFYCRSKDDKNTNQHHDYLSFENMTRLIRLFTELGVSEVRLTGGEPLVRRNLPELAAELSRLPGLDDLSLSTNAHLLERFAAPLKTAGVSRINISLDSIDPDNFLRITRNGNLRAVEQGISAAIAAGMAPIKINMVVMKGINDHEIESMLDYALERGLNLRFIETMPVGKAGLEVMQRHYPATQILDRIRDRFGSQLIPVKGDKGAGPARYYQLGHNQSGVAPATMGVISAVSRHFCEACNRVRLTAKGDLVLCLGNHNRFSLKHGLLNGQSDDELKQDILAAIAKKPERHDFNRQEEYAVPLSNMIGLGG